MEQYVKGFKGFTSVKMCGLSPLASFTWMASAISAHKMRYMASCNEYSKKRLGEISTAAYNTYLENTNYRNRYCN